MSPSPLNEASHGCPHNTPSTGKPENVAMEFAALEVATTADVERGGTSDKEGKLPRADGGRDAWLFLAGCFVFEALVWGFPFSFGVFQSFYTTHPPFSDHAGSIAIVGTCSTGVMYLLAPFSLHILGAWPYLCRRASVLGLVLIVCSLVASSFSTAVWHLIVTQGIMYAFGGSFLYAPTMFYLDEWFIKKKGLAFGVMWAGVGTSGAVFPFLLTALLNRYGFRITLRIWSLTLLVLCTPLIWFVRPRLPPPSTPPPRRAISYSFLLSRTFISLQASNVLESLGFFLPAIYMSSYAQAINVPPVSHALLLALLNSFSIVGAVGLGCLCDHLHVATVVGISTLGSTLAVILLWGLSSSLPLLVLFAVAYGVFAGGYSATWTGMFTEVQRKNPEANMGTLMGLFAAGRGVGAVLSGPVSGLLLAYGGFETGAWSIGYGTGYGALICFTGVSAACGLVCFGAWG